MPENGFDNEDPRGRRPNGKLQPPRMRMSRGVMSWIGFVLVALMIAIVINSEYTPTYQITVDKFYQELGDGKYKSVTVSDDKIIGSYKEPPNIGNKKNVTRFTLAMKVNDPAEFTRELVEKFPNSAEIKYENSNPMLISMLIQLIPWLLIFGFIWFFVLRQIRASAGGAGMLGSFGRSRHRVNNKELTNITFNDVAGVEEAKEEVGEIVEFLKNPKKFQRLGARIPRGVLLVGEPGCGKTLLAKAIAGEADVPFFSISGADFVEMFVGVGASRVRDLFKSAKENSPCIIFLDEIDAVGRRRGSAYNGGGHDEREQTLNAILVEMDGFDTSDQVIVIAATNREDILDPALTRPGRFDRRVYVSLPDVKGRLEILKVHAKKVKMANGVNMMRLARGTPMFSGAELAAIINEAALLATMQNKDAIDNDDLEEARDKIRYGRSNKSRAIEEKERENTAYHEAGHAVVQVLLPNADPLHKVTIIPRGRALGATMSLPEKDRYGYGLKWLHATMRVLCGGRIAEAKHSSDVGSGAAMDIEQVTNLARTMIVDWGMSDRLGFVKYSPDHRNEMLIENKPYSDETAKIIDEEVRRLIDEAFRDATRLINDNWDKVTAVAQALLKFETLDTEEVMKLCRGETLDRPSLSGLLSPDNLAPPSALPAQPQFPPALGGTLPQPG